MTRQPTALNFNRGPRKLGPLLFWVPESSFIGPCCVFQARSHSVFFALTSRCASVLVFGRSNFDLTSRLIVGALLVIETAAPACTHRPIEFRSGGIRQPPNPISELVIGTRSTAYEHLQPDPHFERRSQNRSRSNSDHSTKSHSQLPYIRSDRVSITTELRRVGRVAP